jgi:hypothetical protein
MVRRRVGIVKRNTVEVDVVVAVNEAAEVCLALAQPDAVSAGCEGSGNDLDDFSVVGDGRGKVLNVGIRDQRLCRTLFDESTARSGLCGE